MEIQWSTLLDNLEKINALPVEIRFRSRDWRDYSFGTCLKICRTPVLDTHIHSFTCVHCGNGLWFISITIAAINLHRFVHFIRVSGKFFITSLRFVR